MYISFTKMNGLGNDYIFINALDDESLFDKVNPYISQLSDRNFGIGGDGVIFITRSVVADCQMRMYNSDGREGPMCGNGIRELAKLVWDKKIIRQNPLSVQTQNGVLSLDLTIDKDDKVQSVSVQMGFLDFDPKNIPFNSPSNLTEKNIYTFDFSFNEQRYHFYVGGIGSKHAVCFVEDEVDNIDFCSIGKAIEQDKLLFPEGVNVELVNILSPTSGIMRVWERGSGHTLACGTGATFVAGVGMELGYFSSHATIEIQLEKGSLFISKNKDDQMIMNGVATLVFDGEIELSQFD